MIPSPEQHDAQPDSRLGGGLLYANPFDAPEVPPRSYLRAYLSAPETYRRRHPELVTQIESSETCRRALQWLRINENPGSAPGGDCPGPISFSGAREQLERNLDLPVEPWEIWETSCLVLHANNGKLGGRYMWNPTPVMIVDEEPAVSGLDVVFRAVACSPAGLFSESARTGEDLVVLDEAGNAWVAHLALEFPVSALQLAPRARDGNDPFAGRLTEQSAESAALASAAFAEQLPLDSIDGTGTADFLDDQLLGVIRRRMEDRAQWLSCTADALASMEAEAALSLQGADEAPWSRALDAVPAAAMADPGTISIPCLGWAGGLLDPRGLDPSSGSCVRARAIQITPPAPGELPGAMHAVWEILPSGANAMEVMVPGTAFWVIDRVRGRIIGRGRIEDGDSSRLAVLRAGDRLAFERAPDLVLVVSTSESMGRPETRGA